MTKSSDYCTKCRTDRDRWFFEVRNYLKTHPQSTLMEIHLKTGISLKMLLELQKEEYLPFAT